MAVLWPISHLGSPVDGLATGNAIPVLASKPLHLTRPHEYEAILFPKVRRVYALRDFQRLLVNPILVHDDRVGVDGGEGIRFVEAVVLC